VNDRSVQQPDADRLAAVEDHVGHLCVRLDLEIPRCASRGKEHVRGRHPGAVARTPRHPAEADRPRAVVVIDDLESVGG
jgi:hypothetical protein